MFDRTTDPTPLALGGVALAADPDGALVWPDRRVVVVADLHLEKGSRHAARGTLLPPYDTRATLDRLAAVLDRHRPTQVICLGDSFDDRRAAERLGADDGARLRWLTARHDWVWVAGNHDPAPPLAWGGRAVEAITLGPLSFRHDPAPHDAAAAVGTDGAEVAGHLHPVATVVTRARKIRGRCFATDGQRLILPAFGTYTGGLDVFDPAVRALLGPEFTVHLIARGRIHAVPRRGLAAPR